MANKNYWKCINLEKEDEKANKRIKIKQKNKSETVWKLLLSQLIKTKKNY